MVSARYLDHGQTGEILAATRDEIDHRSGIVFDRRHKVATDADIFYDDTTAYVDALMDEGLRDGLGDMGAAVGNEVVPIPWTGIRVS